MSVTVSNGWMTINTPSPEHWCDQSSTVYLGDVCKARLVRALVRPNGPEDGVEVMGYRDTFDRVWVRCKDFDEASALYKDILNALIKETKNGR